MRMIKLRLSFLLIAFLTLWSFPQSQAQSLDDLYLKIKGKIVDENDQPLPYVHVITVIGRFGATTDAQGRFIVHTAPQDTLWCSYVGYEKQRIPVEIPEGEGELYVNITLSKTSYTLENVDVTVLPENVEDFKDEFSDLVVTEGWKPDPSYYVEYEERRKQKDQLEELPPIAGFDEPDKFDFVSFSPSKLFSKKNKKPKVSKEEQEKINQEIIAEKYNKDWVITLIGPENAGLAEEFMAYCNFNESFLLKSEQYRIAQEVLNKWNRFLDEKYDLK
ncbi:carboxypeptidase-like regulatory domain-containing protein [Persicobacter diffluens]|uniref:Carboxypeptidase-like regulatory domain-containing protein n=1 Tax=Persicobacter diffluens TaxID=981 RepID=A0AAN4VWN0_9BACT|nr:hypothetical protein PEDI_08540 [Persicobacter diffluens]